MMRKCHVASLFLSAALLFGTPVCSRADAFLDAIAGIVGMHGSLTPAEQAQVENAAWAIGFIYSDLEVIIANGYGNYTLNPQFHDWLKTAMGAITNPAHAGRFDALGIVALLNALGIDAAQGDLQQRVALLQRILADNPTVDDDLTTDERAALDDVLAALDAADGLLPSRAGGGAAARDWRETVRQRMGGFSPFSSPIQLSRNLMSRQLLRGVSVGCSQQPAIGIEMWADDWENGADDGISLNTMPYYSGGSETTSFTVGLPLFWTSIDEMESDSFWAVALDGMVRHEVGGGFFVGGHAAGVSNYAEILEDNQFFSLVGGPFAGLEIPMSERLVGTLAVLSEGIYTEKADATWYIAGGAGISALVTDGVVLHVYGLYYRTMDTYNEADDADFFDLGASVEFSLGERTCLSVGASTISGADDADSVTFSIGVRRCL